MHSAWILINFEDVQNLNLIKLHKKLKLQICQQGRCTWPLVFKEKDYHNEKDVKADFSVYFERREVSHSTILIHEVKVKYFLRLESTTLRGIYIIESLSKWLLMNSVCRAALKPLIGFHRSQKSQRPTEPCFSHQKSLCNGRDVKVLTNKIQFSPASALFLNSQVELAQISVERLNGPTLTQFPSGAILSYLTVCIEGNGILNNT